MSGIHKAIIGVLAVMVLAGDATQASARQASMTADAAHAGAVVEPAAAQASVPRLVQFNGTLKDSAAPPVVGVASVTLAIYADQDGGTALWSETQNVIADANGHFSALLGGATASGVPAELFGTGQSRWLGVTIARSAEMPRVLLASVPYALKAQDAETLGGLPASAYVTKQALAASSTRATTPIVSGNTTIIATPQVATAPPDAAAQSAIPQATPSGTGTTDYIPIWTSSSALGNSLLFQTGGRLGFGTTTPAATFDLNGGEILRGGFYEYPQGTATASAGQPSHSFQWLASVFNSSTKAAVDYAFGFRAIPQNNDTASPAAKLDLFYGTGGPTGSTSDLGLSISNTGVITFAPGQTFDAVTASSLNLPNSNDGTSGIITLGGIPFLSTTGSPDNLFLGVQSGINVVVADDPFANTAVGTATLTSLTSGNSNTAVGEEALYSTTSGSNDIAIGADTLFNNTIGTADVAVGNSALTFNVAGTNNVAVGETALRLNTQGNYNTAIGDDAGDSNTGSSNTYLGAATNGTAGISGATAIGYQAFAGQSNSIILGANAASVGIGTSTPHSQLEISGPSGTSFTAPSPLLTVTGTTGGDVGIDFNTAGISTTGTYNPSVRMAVLNESSGNVLAFYANKPGGGLNNGLQQTFAVDAAGNVAVTGNLSKGGGSFKIDDPIDPANKYLSHSFVESPDMMNIYNGIATLDAQGEAVIEMPEWFQALNRDFRYQLTAIGAPAPKLYVGAEIADNHFKIAGGKKGQRVSWQVTGIRQDAWANAHRIPNEELKPAGEQGHYLHPDLFGAGPDKAISAAHIAAADPTAAPTATARQK